MPLVDFIFFAAAAVIGYKSGHSKGFNKGWDWRDRYDK